MIRRTGLRIGLWGIAVLTLLGVGPASALAGTIADGNYTASPGQENHLQIAYDAASNSYAYRDFPLGTPAPLVDGDGPGGCSVTSPGDATCPASLVSHIDVSLLDGNDMADLCACVPGFGLQLGGSIVTVGATVEGGDGEDGILGGAGDDTVSGGADHDGVTGGPGNDTVLGGDGADAVDFPGSVGGPPPIGVVQPYDSTAGTDRVDGGPGHDQVGGIEGTISGLNPSGGCCVPIGFDPTLVRSDLISCGDSPDDVAFYGPTDQVNIDCEQLIQVVPCPAGSQTCEGVVTVYATATTQKASATSASAKKKKKKRKRVAVGSARFTSVIPGTVATVYISLQQTRLQRVLGGRQRAPAEAVAQIKKKGKKGKKSEVASTAKTKKKKFRVVGRTRFTFTKG